MKINKAKNKLTTKGLKTHLSDFWKKNPMTPDAKDAWKMVVIYHGLPADKPELQAEAYYNAKMDIYAGFDAHFAEHTIHAPTKDAKNTPEYRNEILSHAVKTGLSVVVSVSDNDAALMDTLKAAKEKGYRIELVSYLSHMTNKAPSDDYNWDAHIGALEILPLLQSLSDQWSLNWKRLPYALSETAMAPYIGAGDDKALADLTNRLYRAFPQAAQPERDIYDTIVSAYRPDGTSSEQVLMALHLGSALEEAASGQADLVVTPSPDLRSGDFVRLLKRIGVDITRLTQDGSRAFESLTPQQRSAYGAALQNLNNTLANQVSERAYLGLTEDERLVMRFPKLQLKARRL